MEINQSPSAKHGLSEWPKWFFEASPGIAATLSKLSEAHRRFCETTKDGYEHNHVIQQQINDITDSHVAAGDFDPVTKKFLRPVSIHKQAIKALVYNNGSAYRILGMTCAAKQMILAHLLEMIHTSLVQHNLIGALISLRGAIEHIAHFDAIIVEVMHYSVPASFTEANVILQEINGLLVKTVYGSRVDWKGLLAGDTEDLLKRNKTKYKPESNRADRTAETVLNAIDGMGKQVKGVRAVYEVLCEFAHPNVGLIFGLTESVEPYMDREGVCWIRKRISRNAPYSAVTDLGDVLSPIFSTLAQCLERFELLLIEGETQRRKILQISQVVLRHALNNNRDLLSPYVDCPCGSGAKVKFCCRSSFVR